MEKYLKKKITFVFLLAIALLPFISALQINDTIYFSSVSNSTIYVKSMTLDQVIVTNQSTEFYNLTSLDSNFTNINSTYDAKADFYGLLNGFTLYNVNTSTYLFTSSGTNKNYNATFSSGETLTIFSFPPQIEYSAGTEANGTIIYSRDWILVNVSVVEVNEDTITFILLNSSFDIISSNSFTDETRTVIWTLLIDDDYYYYVTINDTHGNTNQTKTRQIIIFNDIIEFYPLFTGEIIYTGKNPAIYNLMRSSGAGMGLLFEYLGLALPVLLIILAMVSLIVVIGFGIREAIMKHNTKSI